MDYKKIKINKTSIFIFLLSFIILICYIFIFKSSPTNKDLKKLNSICSTIETSNYNLKDAIKDDTIDISNTNNILCDNLVTLNNCLDDLDKLSLESTNNNNIKTDLTNTLKSNIKLFELTKDILSNDSSKKFNDTFSEYTLQLDNVKKNYESLKNSNLKIVFPMNAINFFDCVTNYSNALIKISRDDDISFEQKRTFCLALKKTIDSLENISDNLEPTIVDIYNNNRSLDSLSSDIQNKKSSINKLKYDSYKLIVPQNCTKYYDKLQETINSYNTYITSFSTALNTHKTSGSKFDISLLNSNYKDSFSKYNDYETTFSELKEDVNNLNKENN